MIKKCLNFFKYFKSKKIFKMYGGIARYVLDESLQYNLDYLEDMLINRIENVNLSMLFSQGKSV